jgi:hypothetical protein
MCQRGGCEWTEIREPGLNSHDDDGDGGMPQEYRSARIKNQDPPTFGIPRLHSTTHGERYFSRVGHAIQVPLTRLGIARGLATQFASDMLREHVLMPLHARVRTIHWERGRSRCRPPLRRGIVEQVTLPGLRLVYGRAETRMDTIRRSKEAVRLS